jgi:hypothetical protein
MASSFYLFSNINRCYLKISILFNLEKKTRIQSTLHVHTIPGNNGYTHLPGVEQYMVEETSVSSVGRP